MHPSVNRNSEQILIELRLINVSSQPCGVWVAGLVAMMAKVMLVLAMELAFLPVAYGFWLDICALPLFEGSLAQRLGLLRSAPVTWTLLHWMIGMACLMVTAAFLSVVRSVLRPGNHSTKRRCASAHLP